MNTLMAPDAERNILGALMTPGAGAPIYDAVTSQGLRVEDFSTDSTRRVFAAISTLQEAGEPSEFDHVRRELERNKQLDRIGDTGFLASCFEGCADTPIGVHRDVREVREKARLRRINAMLAAFSSRLEAGEDSSALLNDLTESIGQIQTGINDPRADHVCRFADAVTAELQQDANQEGLAGLTTGIPRLNEYTSGIRPGEYWIIGGRAGDGKSTLALQIVAANCSANIPVHLFSLEMTKKDVLARLVAGLGTVPFPKIRKLSKADLDTVAKGANAIGTTWPLYVTTDSPLTVGELCSRARVSIRSNNTRLIVVDYLQLLANPAKDERERITRISGRLRDLAKNTGVPVIALSQLSRPIGGDLRPTKFSLKESGALEADAHCVVAIYRPVDESRHPTGLDELCVVKQRHGPTGDIPVKLNVDLMKFERDYSPREKQNRDRREPR